MQLVVNHQRVSHRERVALALAHGGGVGQIQIAGVWASVFGWAGVDWARLMFADVDALGDWRRTGARWKGGLRLLG